MRAWLFCEISAGRFSAEVAVRGEDYNGEQFSLFVQAVRVKSVPPLRENEWVSGKIDVEILESQGGFDLVELPGQTFGNGQTITVREDQLERSRPAQPA